MVGRPIPKKHPPRKQARRDNTARSNASTSSGKSFFSSIGSFNISSGSAVSQTLLLIWVLVGAELVLDLVTSIISFLTLVQKFECCDETVELKGRLLGVTVPFFALILLEISMLIFIIRRQWNITPEQSMLDDEREHNDNSWSSFLGSNVYQKVINFLLVFNPFFGFLVAWMLLYQSNREESMTVLGIEAASLALHWLSVYLEGNKQTKISLAFHILPAIPFAVSVIVILYALNQGGVCYLVDEAVFWYKGCLECPGNVPAPEEGCADGTPGTHGTYCNNDDGVGNFCFFSYQE